MGVTYKALDTDLQRPVALKVINSDLLADEVNRDRFLREARAAAGLRHNNIASIYHLGKEPAPVKGRQLVTFKPSFVRNLWRNDEEQFFYAMEFIEGQTTESYVARFGPMPLRSALRIAWQVSKALVAAARQQFVHRDIKPANIIIVADSEEGDWPFVKLIDFGLARSVLLAHDSDGTTRPGFLDTAQSRSVEQIEEGNMDARSDIYSLGCTLWYLLTGEAPVTGSPAAVTSALTQQLGGEPSWEKLKPFPRRIRRLLRRMLRKGPSQRPASVVELRREIELCLADIERREALAARIALPLNIGRQWMTAAPWSHRAAIFGASVIGLVLAFGYYGNSDPSSWSAPAMQTSGVVRAQDSANSNQRIAKEAPGWSYLGTNPSSPSVPPMQTSDAVRTQDSANSNEWLAKERPGWSYLSTWDEPFRSLALARRLSFAERAAPDRGIIGAKSWLLGDSIWDSGVAKPVAVKDDSWSGKGGRFSMALASDYSFGVGDSEDDKAAMRKGLIRDKDKVKKTTKRSVKRPQRRVTSRDRDRGFSPLQEVQRAREHIRRVIRRIL